MTERQAYAIKQGETFLESAFFAYWDESTQTLVNYDLLGATLFAQLRATPDNSTPVLLTMHLGTGFTLAAGFVQGAANPNPPTDPNGWTVELSAATIATLPSETTYYYDVFVTFPTSVVTCLQSVALTIEATTGAG